jgi:hypothetical protein
MGRLPQNIQQLMSKSLKVAQYLPRNMWAMMFGGGGFGRDYYGVFGWERTLDTYLCMEMYKRGGIAKRIIDAYPDATWARPPAVTGPSKAFTNAFQDLVDDFDLWGIIHRADKLSRIGRYSVILVGTETTNLMNPVQPGEKLLYLQPYSDVSARITRWGNDPTDPRFGLPLMYTVYPNLLDKPSAPGTVSSWGVPTRTGFQVHWSRMIHIVQGNLEDNVYAIPYLSAGWNYLTDIMKITGGAAESFWATANRGLQADVKDDYDLGEDGEAALTAEIDEYMEGMRRFIRTKGVTIKSLGSDVADPSGPARMTLSLISGTYAIPQRVLLGSESGHAASTQDKGAFAEQIEQYRTNGARPKVIIPIIQGLQLSGTLPAAKIGKVTLNWPDAYRLSPLERAQMSNQTATAANNLSLAMKNVPNMLSVEESRTIVGWASDNGMLTEMSTDIPEGDTRPELPVPTTPVDGKNTSGRQKSPDGGTPKSGPGSGNKSTPGQTDANGSADPVQTRTGKDN